MPTTSTRLGMQIFAGTDLVSNIDTIDAQAKAIIDTLAVDRQGTHAARPAANTVPNGYYYYETDTGRTVRGDGSAWHGVLPGPLDITTGMLGANVVTAPKVDTAFAKDNVEAAFSSWKPILRALGTIAGSTTAATYLFVSGGQGIASGGQSATAVFQTGYLDPADYAATGRTTKYRVRLEMLTNDIAPTVTFTAGLYPITSAGVTDRVGVTLGTVVASSTAAIGSVTADSTLHAESSAFNAPTAGFYALAVNLSGTTASGSREVVAASLQYQQV